MASPKKKINKKTTKSGSETKLKQLDPSGKTSASFFKQVYDLVEQIPKGRVTTYGAIARSLGSGLSARMVGWALNGSFLSDRKIPAQRVVNRNGQLSGKAHFPTHTRMQELLEKEGIKILDDVVQNFEQVFWDPAEEL
jgi:methylated-DNA-protein-cysteine methyltransferase-like protein